MKKLLIIIFCSNFLTSFSQEKSYLDFINNMTPVFPGCEKSEDKSLCYNTNFGNLIIAQINEENTRKQIDISRIEIELLIRTEANGKSTILKSKTKDTLIQKLVDSALEKIPLVQPLYSETTKEYVTSSQGLIVVIHKNIRDNIFELYSPKRKFDLSSKPFPITKITKHIGFQDCENENAENFSKCFQEKFKMWLKKNIKNNLKEHLQGQKAKLKLTFDRNGNLTYTIVSETAEIKEELAQVLKTFPKVKPAESNDEKISVSYSIPVAF